MVKSTSAAVFQRVKANQDEKGEFFVFKRMKEDVETIFENDPAARSVFEVVLTYSGLHATWAHRVAHWFFKGAFIL